MPNRIPTVGIASLGLFALMIGSTGLAKTWRSSPLGSLPSTGLLREASSPPSGATGDPCDGAPPPALRGYVAAVIPGIEAKGAPIDLAVVDVDLDGERDIVVSRGGLDTAPVREQGVVEVLFGPHRRPQATCGSTVTAPQARRRWASSQLEPYGKMATGDIDGNGCPDIVVGKFNGGLDVFLGTKTLNGTCKLADAPTSMTATSTRDADPSFRRGAVGVAALQLADLDGDGRLDLVVGRYHREYGLRGVVQQVYWNEGGKTPFSSDSVWESEEGITAAMSVVTADIDGDQRTDVLFGARGVWDDSGASATAWGVLYKGGAGRALRRKGQRLHRSDDVTDPLKSPMVVDMVPMPHGRVLVSSSLHWCNAFPSCEDAAKLEIYAWDGATMSRTARFADEPSGNWLRAAVGGLGQGPTEPAIAAGFACGKAKQTPGHLRVYPPGRDQAVAYGFREHLVRAIAIDDLRGGTSAVRGPGEIILGTVSSNSNNTGAITILFKCD